MTQPDSKKADPSCFENFLGGMPPEAPPHCVAFDREVTEEEFRELESVISTMDWSPKWLERLLEPWHGVFAQCKRPSLFPKPTGSPIEEKMAQALHKWLPPHVEVMAEKPVGNYRVDFLTIDPTTRAKICVEADSWEWHSSKAQFNRDRERSRDIQQRGYVVFSFSGRQINEDADLCAAEIAEYLLRKWVSIHAMRAIKYAGLHADSNKASCLAATSDGTSRSVWHMAWFDWAGPAAKEIACQRWAARRRMKVLSVDEALALSRSRA